MKVVITVFNKVNQTQKLIMFGARDNLMKVNYGNSIYIEFSKIEADEEYESAYGKLNSLHAFMQDCIKYNLKINLINGKPLKQSFKVDNITFDVIQEEKELDGINPYNETYETLVFGGENKFEIEFYGFHSSRKKRLMLLS